MTSAHQHVHPAGNNNETHASCCDVDVNTKFKWYNKIINGINSLSNYWAFFFSTIILLMVLNEILVNNWFLDVMFDYKSIPMIVIATLAMLLMFPTFLLGFIKEVKTRSFGLMTTVAFSAAVAYFLSMGLFISNYVNNTEYTIYFDSSIAIMVFLLWGIAIEGKINKQGTYDIHQMLKLKGSKVVTQDGQVLPLESIKVGAKIYINQRSDILVDGVILEGQTYVTEAFLTGEQNPIFKKKGMLVNAGSTNIGQRILVQVEKTLEHSNIARIVQQSKSIAMNKSKVQKIADRIGRYLILVEILGAILAFIYKFFAHDVGAIDAIVLSITAFVVMCPCALGILTPAIFMASASVMNKRNILVKKSDAFSHAKKIKYAIFDKTGTVVSNKLLIEKWNGSDESLAIIKGMEAISEHPIAKSIFSYKPDIHPLKNIKPIEILGVGLKLDFKGDTYHLGGSKLLQQFNLNYPLKNGEVVLLKNGKVLASFIYKNKINPQLKELIVKLKKDNITTILLSGDNEINVSKIAKDLAFDKYYSNKSPEEKEKVVGEYKKLGKVVYIGDGINDIIALSKADISVSISSEFNSFNIPSDIIVFNDAVANVYAMLDIMKKTQTYIVIGLLWAMIYNAGIFFAIIFADIPPSYGALLMLFSNVVVLLVIVIFKLLRLEKKEYFKNKYV